MPQLDKLTFTSQVFWFFLLFIFLYYSLSQMTLVRLKFILGLKRFFFHSNKYNSFYKLSRKLKISSRYDLLFFFDSGAISHLNGVLSSDLSFDLLKNRKSFFLSYYIESFFQILDSYKHKFTKTVNSTALYDYTFVLDLNKSAYVYSYIYMSKVNVIELKDFVGLTKSVNYFYEQFFNIFSYFFKAVHFYIYETIFVLFYYFFNVFFQFREILYFFKLMNKLTG
jgi:hypothetical protein